MATVATSQEIKAVDPLATCNIPEVIEDMRDAANGRIVSYKRGKLLGKVRPVCVVVSTPACRP
jgi:hypothetical protein